MVLAAALLTVDSVFLFGFAGFMLTAVVAFILIEMRHISGKATIHSARQTNHHVAEHGDLTSRRMATSLAIASPVWCSAFWRVRRQFSLCCHAAPPGI